MAVYANLQLPTILIAGRMCLFLVWLVVVEKFIAATSVEVNGKELSLKPFIEINYSIRFSESVFSECTK